MIEGSIRDHLLTDPAITARVDDRVYPELAPTNAELPLLVVTVASEQRDYDLVNADGDYQEARAQIDSYAETSSDAGELAKLVDARMAEYYGEDVVHGVTVQLARRESKAQISTRDGDQVDRRVSSDFLVAYSD